MAKDSHEILDHTADTGLRVWGPDPAAVFLSAAEGLFELVCEPGGVTPVEVDAIELTGENWPELLREWLSELLYRFTADGRLYCEFGIDELTETKLRGWAKGETADDGRHVVNTELKAVTYHQLKCEQVAGQWEAQVVFDV